MLLVSQFHFVYRYTAVQPYVMWHALLFGIWQQLTAFSENSCHVNHDIHIYISIMLATWLSICASILFPVPVVSKSLLLNLLIDYCEFAINASSGQTIKIMYKVRNARNSLCSSTQFRLSTADAAKVAQFVCETGQGYSLSSEELQFTFVNCLQIIHKFKHEHEKENSLHVVGAVGPLTMSCIGDTDSNKQQS